MIRILITAVLIFIGDSVSFAQSNAQILTGTGTADTTAPIPNPMTFEVPPTALSSTSIRMVATTATDENGVSYYFKCDHFAYNSGWQSSPEYIVEGLQEGTKYIFSVKARDNSENYNETAFSEEFSVTTKTDPDYLNALMVSPKYRNAIYPTMVDPDSIKIKIHLKSIFFSDYQIDVVLSQDGNTIKSWNFSDLAENMLISLSVADITFEYTRSSAYTKDDNPYKFTIELKKNEEVEDTAVLKLNKYPLPPTGVNEIRFDDDNNLVINGERIIMYGSYLFQYNKDWYSYLEGLGLNSFVEWGSQLTGGYHADSTWGLIRTNSSDYNNIDATRQNVKNYRENPHLLGYRTVDEPNSHDISPETVRLHYQAALEEDPYHPVYVVIKNQDHPAQNYPYTGYTDCADIFALDLYPVYKETAPVSDTDIGVIYQNYKYLRNSKLGRSEWVLEDMATVAIPQLFNQSHWRLPLNTEYKNLVFQHIAGGARSFFSYSYENLSGYNNSYEYYAQTLVPELESIKEAVFAEESNKGVNISSTNDARLVWSRRVTADKEYLILINTTSKWNLPSGTQDQLITATVTFANDWNSKVYSIIRDSGMPAYYTIENGKITVELQGINESSSGVIVLYRYIDPASLNERTSISFPESYSLEQNYPNPFNPETEISFSIPESAKTNLSVYNTLGQKVAEFVDKELNTGTYNFKFNGADLPSGLYFYRLQTDHFSQIKKMILIK